MLMTATSTAGGVHNLQTKLTAVLDDLGKPVIRITDEVSDLHNALKGASHTTIYAKVLELITIRK